MNPIGLVNENDFVGVEVPVDETLVDEEVVDGVLQLSVALQIFVVPLTYVFEPSHTFQAGP